MRKTQLLTVPEVADYLRVSVATVRRWCADGTLPAIKAGRAYRVPQASLDKFNTAEESA